MLKQWIEGIKSNELIIDVNDEVVFHTHKHSLTQYL